jgi:hypothetical protein
VSTSPAHRTKRGVPYRIVVKGNIRSSFVGPLEGMTVESVSAKSNLLIDVRDQSHLCGIVQALSDRGIQILSFDVATGDESFRRRLPGCDRWASPVDRHAATRSAQAAATSRCPFRLGRLTPGPGAPVRRPSAHVIVA